MKTCTIINRMALMALVFTLLYSCGGAETPQDTEPVAADTLQRSGPMENPEIPAQFPGGNDSLMKWMAANISYPEGANADSVQGQVVVSFIVDRFGGLFDVKVEKSLHSSCDAVAVLAVKSMPKWTPAKNGGEDVASKLFLPVDFRLPEEQTSN
jgi:TonB family protein